MTSKQISLNSSKFQSLLDTYENDPLMRALVALVGGIPVFGSFASALDAALIAQWENSKAQRFKILLQELNSGQRFLTEKLIQDEPFIFAFTSITKAAINTRKKEKIALFARLLRNACIEKRHGSDEFEEYLSILDDLSYRELRILLILKKFEEDFQLQIKILDSLEQSKQSKESWKLFQNAVSSECDIPSEQLIPILMRISRTGLCEVEPDYIIVSNEKNIVNMGDAYTTPRLTDFLTWLQSETEEN